MHARLKSGKNVFTENMKEDVGIISKVYACITQVSLRAQERARYERSWIQDCTLIALKNLLASELDWHFHLGSVKIAIVGATKLNVPP